MRATLNKSVTYAFILLANASQRKTSGNFCAPEFPGTPSSTEILFEIIHGPRDRTEEFLVLGFNHNQ